MLSTAHHCVSEFRRTEELNNPNFKKSVDLKLGCIAQLRLRIDKTMQ